MEHSESTELVTGDRIKVNLEQEVWKLMQESCGEWDDNMAIVRRDIDLVGVAHLDYI